MPISQFTVHNSQYTNDDEFPQNLTICHASSEWRPGRVCLRERQEGLELTASLSLSLSYCHLRRCQMDRAQSQAPTKISVGVVICYLSLHPSALRHSPSWFWAYTVARSKSTSREPRAAKRGSKFLDFAILAHSRYPPCHPPERLGGRKEVRRLVEQRAGTRHSISSPPHNYCII